MTNLGAGASVLFGSKPARVVSATDTAVWVEVPRDIPKECLVLVQRGAVFSNGARFQSRPSVKLEIGANPLDVGATTQARFLVLQTAEPLAIAYTLKNPDVVRVAEGNEGVVLSSGGTSNQAVLNVTGIAGPRLYSFDYSWTVSELIVEVVRLHAPTKGQ